MTFGMEKLEWFHTSNFTRRGIVDLRAVSSRTTNAITTSLVTTTAATITVQTNSAGRHIVYISTGEETAKK